MGTMYTESLRAFLKPVVPYLDDVEVSEILINGPDSIWIEKKGRLTKTTAKFTIEGLEAAARNMAQFVGRTITEERPRLDARLPDGSRIHVVMAPIARQGTTISIRKFFRDKLTMQDLVKFGSLTQEMMELLRACVELKLNIIVSGGTGSGKTTFLNILSTMIPDDERILTIEDSAELQLQQDHLVAFESRPPDKFGKGGVDMGDLLHSALRLRPDRIVVGEVRGGECFYLMQAMNTGHGGSLATAHANTPTDTLRRLESLCLMSSVEMPMVAVRAQVASAINLVVCTERFQDGSRRTSHISEVLPLDDRGEYRTQDLFVYTPTGKNADGKIIGYHAPTGIVPTFFQRLKAYGYGHIKEDFFDPLTYGMAPPPVFTSDMTHKTKWVSRLKNRETGQEDSEELKEMMKNFVPPEPAKPAPKPPEKPADKPPEKAFEKPPEKTAAKPAEAPRPASPRPPEKPRREELERPTDAAAAAPKRPASRPAAPAVEEDDGLDPEFEKQMEEEIARAAKAAPDDDDFEHEETPVGRAPTRPVPRQAGAAAPRAAAPPREAPPPSQVDSGPSIRISADLLEEAEQVMPKERTMIRRVPVTSRERDDEEDERPPSAPGVNKPRR